MVLFTHKQALRAHPSTAPLPMPSAAGSAESLLLKRYRPLETRGVGSFGSVEICLDSRLQRRVAIKRIPLAPDSTSINVQNISAALSEARLAAMLQHPNIVAVHDFTYDAVFAYLVMEYVDGLSLEEFLARVDGHSLTYDELAYVVDALASALAFAHENRMLHLDIKPANVLIDHAGHIKLTDFGMAALASAAGFGGARGGTIGYMPPEQLTGQEVDERSDIFALACVLYEGLCGTTPFRTANPASSLERIRKGVLPPSEVLEDMPERSEAILLAALSEDPEARSLSVADFARDFVEDMGQPRVGQRSFALMIERLCSDEGRECAEESDQEMPVSMDRAEGSWGSRNPQARRIARGIVVGLSTIIVETSLLSLAMLGEGAPETDVAGLIEALMSRPEAAGILAVSVAAGVASGFAPMLSPALICSTLLICCGLGATTLASLPLMVGIVALGAGWWLVWGHKLPGAAMGVSALVACALLAEDPVAAAPIAISLLSYSAPPKAAAASAVIGLLASCVAVLAAGGITSLNAPSFAAMCTVSLMVKIAALVALAFIESSIFAHIATAWPEKKPTSAILLACVLPLCVSILLIYLAHPMEIAFLSSWEVTQAVGVGALSSIIVWVCLYALGYKKDALAGEYS